MNTTHKWLTAPAFTGPVPRHPALQRRGNVAVRFAKPQLQATPTKKASPSPQKVWEHDPPFFYHL